MAGPTGEPDRLARALATAAVVCLMQSSALGQTFASFSTTGGTYSQSFSAMSGTVNVNRASKGTGTFAELTTANVSNLSSDLTGWFIQADSGINTYWAVDNGADNAGAFYEMYDSSGNHALGSLGSSTMHGYWGIALINNTGGTLNDFNISYNEVINRNPSSVPNPYAVSYLVTGDTTSTFQSAGFVNTTLGFTTPSSGTGAGHARFYQPHVQYRHRRRKRLRFVLQLAAGPSTLPPLARI